MDLFRTSRFGIQVLSSPGSSEASSLVDEFADQHAGRSPHANSTIFWRTNIQDRSEVSRSDDVMTTSNLHALMASKTENSFCTQRWVFAVVLEYMIFGPMRNMDSGIDACCDKKM